MGTVLPSAFYSLLGPTRPLRRPGYQHDASFSLWIPEGFTQSAQTLVLNSGSMFGSANTRACQERCGSGLVILQARLALWCASQGLSRRSPTLRSRSSDDL